MRAFCDLLLKAAKVCVTHMLTRLNDELVCAIAPTYLLLMAIKALEALSFPGYFQMHKVNVTLLIFRENVTGLFVSRVCSHYIAENLELESLQSLIPR